MLICNYCGNTFENDDLENGMCPFCHNDEYETAYQCHHCGEYFAEQDLEWHYCEDCYDKLKDDYRHDLKGLRGLTDDTWDVPINVIYSYFFTNEQIDEILFKELENSKTDLTPFIENDKSYFLQQLDFKKKGV